MPAVPPPAADTRRTILLVEDDAGVREAVRGAVGGPHDVWMEAATATDALATASIHPPELVLLDLGLPDLDGIEVCRRLRAWGTVPIIVLSARHDEAEKVALLDAGADDYVTKPFGPAELRARVEAQLRRARSVREPAPRLLRAQGLTIDLTARTVTRDGTVLRLTPTEWALLAALAAHAGRTVTQRQLFRAVWGEGTFGDAPQYLRVYITHLRKKVERVAHAPKLIVTEPGVGYRLEPGDDA